LPGLAQDLPRLKALKISPTWTDYMTAFVSDHPDNDGWREQVLYDNKHQKAFIRLIEETGIEMVKQPAFSIEALSSRFEVSEELSHGGVWRYSECEDDEYYQWTWWDEDDDFWSYV